MIDRCHLLSQFKYNETYIWVITLYGFPNI